MKLCVFRHKKFPIVCYFSSTYSLLLYLCYSSQREIENTFFVFSETFPKEIAYNFKNCCYIPKYKESIHFYVPKKWIISKIYKWFVIPKIESQTKIFCQDHTTMLQLLIGRHPYYMVAENPVMETIMKSHYPKGRATGQTIKQHILDFINQKFIGPLYGHSLGFNHLCRGVLFSDKGSARYFHGKDIYLLNIFSAWNQKNENERNMILSLYGICSSDLESISSKKIIIYTQPFVPEMTIDDNKKYMVALIKKYPLEDIVIKVHPRDEIDYEQLFPGITVCKSRIPAQLFDLLGVHFEVAATYNSSAVYNMSYEIRIDWYGEELRHFGSVLYNAPIPSNANMCHL